MSVGRMSRNVGCIAACVCAAGLALDAPAASGNHPVGVLPGELGLTESELRQHETETLGAEHAAEHARQRSMAGQPEEVGSAPAADRASSSLRLAGPPDQVGQWERSLLDPGLRHPRRDAADRQGDVVVLPVRPRPPNTAQAWLWDPATGQSTRVDPPQVPDPDNPGQTKAANIWCSGQSLLADGRVLVTGGNLEYSQGGPPNDWKGLEQGLHVQPLQRDLDRAALDGARALVPEPGAAPRRAHGDHGRTRRERQRRAGEGRSSCSRRAPT